MPHMLASGFGRVITMSPPIVTDMRAYAGKTAYYMSKFGMTMVALGAAAEGEGGGSSPGESGRSCSINVEMDCGIQKLAP